mmetsp:Transcript_28560/g.53559  ORF Transcript_28560/g.53559 Transcript_28560/m.53559 type:complete len:109 (-) Transcript_28560:55-381(-)
MAEALPGSSVHHSGFHPLEPHTASILKESEAIIANAYFRQAEEVSQNLEIAMHTKQSVAFKKFQKVCKLDETVCEFADHVEVNQCVDVSWSMQPGTQQLPNILRLSNL